MAGARFQLGWGADRNLMVAMNVNRLEGPRHTLVDEGTQVGALKEPNPSPFQDYERVKNATLSFQWGAHQLLANAWRGDEGFLGNIPVFPNSDATPPYPGDGIGNNQSTRGVLASYTLDAPLGEGLGLRTGLSYDWQERNFSRKGDDSHRSNVQGFRTSAFLKLNYQATQTFGLEAGADYDRRVSNEYTDYLTGPETVVWDFDMRDRAVSERSIFAQGKCETGKLSLLLGSRYTWNENAGSNVSSRFTAVYMLDASNSLKLIAGQSFRAPSLFELFFRTNTNTVMGNSKLKAEKADSLEVAYVARVRRFFVQTLAYLGKYSDKILRVTDPSDVTRKIYVNAGTFRATGLEFAANYINPERIDGFLNVDCLLKTDSGDEAPAESGCWNFRFVPRWNVSAGLSKRFGSFFVSANGKYRASTHGPDNAFRQDSDGNWTQGPSQELGGQGYVNFTAGFTQQVRGAAVTHTFSVKNVGNRELMTPDYVRRMGLNAVPTDGLGRQVSYTVRLAF